MSVADGRSLKVVGFGDIGVMFQSGESIIPMKHEAMQCGTRTRDLLQPVFAHRPFREEVTHSLEVGQGGAEVSLQQSKRSMLFDKCVNPYQVPNFTGLGLALQVEPFSL